MGRSHRTRPLTPRFFLASCSKAEMYRRRKTLARDQDNRCFYCRTRMTPPAKPGQVPLPDFAGAAKQLEHGVLGRAKSDPA